MIQRSINTLFILIFVANSFFAQNVLQESLVPSDNCSSDARIEFVRYDKRQSIYSDESDDRVWLRFVNKTRNKTLKVDADDSQLTLDFLKRKSKELGIYYEMVKKANCNAEDVSVSERPVGYTRREVYITTSLKPGETFVFSVAREHLSAGNAIYLTYECEKNCDQEMGESKKAYFFSLSLPQNGQSQSQIESDISVCKLPLPRSIKQAKADFSITYSFEVNEMGKPSKLTKVRDEYVGKENFLACVEDWRIRGLPDETKLVVMFKWKHGLGWTEIIIAAKSFNQVIRVKKGIGYGDNDRCKKERIRSGRTCNSYQHLENIACWPRSLNYV